MLPINPMNVSENKNVDESPSNWRAIDAEQRVNLVRITAIAGFYLIHLLHYYAPRLGDSVVGWLGFDSGKPFPANAHLAVTVLALVWLMQAFAVHFMLQQRRAPDWLATVTTCGDLFWLTAILTLSTGPKSPMVVGYFLILIMTGLRFNLRLVRLATVATIAAYVFLLGAAKWPRGLLKEIEIESVPRHHQLIIVVALLFAGILIGQIVRHGYAIADDIARRWQEKGQQ